MENFDVVRKLIDLVKEISPLIWEATKMQVYAQAYINTAYAVAFMLMSVVAVKASSITYKKTLEIQADNKGKGYLDKDDGIIGWSIATVILAVLAFVFMLISGEYLGNAFQMLYAPDYHTIKILLETVK